MDAPAETGPASTAGRRWLVAALAIASIGTAGALLGARLIASNEAQQSLARFRLASHQVAADAQLGIDQENALLIATAAFFKQEPHASTARFDGWLTDVQAFRRYPEILGVGLIDLVPHRQLASWLRRHPVSGGMTQGIVPAGNRPYYCLTSAGAYSVPLPNVDACALSPMVHEAIAAGTTQEAPFSFGTGLEFFAASAPVYRGVGMPATVAERRRAFLGWAAMLINPQELLQRAIANHPGLRVVIRGNGVTFAAGRAPRGANRITIALSSALGSVTVLGGVFDGSVLGYSNSLAVLIGGTALSLMLAVLLLSLATGRARAMRLVAQKTGELSFLALHDALTNLPNRALVLDRLEHALARAARSQRPLAVLYVDIDGFKAINDTLGHAAGDEVLRVVAARLTGALRDEDTVGRIGGDEFVALLESSDLLATPELVAERVLEVLRQPIELGSGKRAHVSASIGIAVGQADTGEELLHNADLALYAAKDAGKNRCVVFEDAMQIEAADRYALESDLQEALARDELFLVYQPTFDLRDGTVSGVEALIRWRHPTRGTLGPGAFIPLAEESGQIIEIGQWVLSEACDQAAGWLARGFEAGISVNVSARQLELASFVDDVAGALADTGLPAERLTLEITETLLMRDPDDAAGQLLGLKALGVRIAIDDFGTGYSSLAYLRQFPVDALKIDRSFISGISASSEAAALMHTLVQLGKTLGLETLGEGIEEQSQLDRLRREDCDYGQGFLLARPLPAGAVEEFLIRESTPSPRFL